MTEKASVPESSRYRRDIDGLRAIAVLLVVAFHMGLALPQSVVPWVNHHISHTLGYLLSIRSSPTGGFVGVDIFFVISGYLISGILLREQADHTFSILNFYERRIRRIFPALMAVLLFTLLVAYFAFTPPEIENFAKSLLAATFSVANIYFWRTTFGYFAPDGMQRPLLHTWSLAVEEQFYLFFPILLLFFHRLLRDRKSAYLKAAILVLAVGSFIASQVVVQRDVKAAFYLPYTRAWELLLGTILSMGMLPPVKSALGRNVLSAAGLGLVVYSAFFFSSVTIFPGMTALIPCLGAVFLISSGATGSSVVGRILSSPPFVFIGLISYSLYLWHWPLLLINRWEYFPGVNLRQRSLCLLMLVTATLSWRFIERPFRRGPLKLPRRQLFVAAGLSTALLAAIGVVILASHGMTWRYSQDQLQLANQVPDGLANRKWGGDCFEADISPVPVPASCLTSASDRPNYLLFGDSHAAHLWLGLTTAFPEINFLEATAPSCKPLMTSRNSPQGFCRDLVDRIFTRFLPTHALAGVILSCVWQDTDLKSLAETVAWLHAANLRVYVIGPLPVYDQALPTLLIRAARSGDSTFPARHMVMSREAYNVLDDQLADAALKNGAVRYISLRKILCSTSSCLEFVGANQSLQFDGMHLSNTGSIEVARRIRAANEFP